MRATFFASGSPFLKSLAALHRPSSCGGRVMDASELLGGAQRVRTRVRGFAPWAPRGATAELLDQVRGVLEEYEDIAANAIETPRLLLISTNGGRTPKGIANTSDMVGRNLMDHPYYVVWGMSPKQIYPYRGPLITSGICDLCEAHFVASARRSASTSAMSVGISWSVAIPT